MGKLFSRVKQMKITAPDYYSEFRCIASACRHSCCEGWEIDIDRESAQRYEELPGKLGERLRANMEPAPEDEKNDENYAHFRLMEGDRCPFLRRDGLCDIITEEGEGMLCQICSDHPRFRNFWEDRTELGLGLACEEAARIILTREKPMTIVTLEDDGESTEIPPDEEWLMSVRNELFEDAASRTYDHPAEQRLMEYLIWRHIADALYDDRLEERIEFVEDSFRKIVSAWHDSAFPDISALIEICRVFSNEVEYSIEDHIAQSTDR